MLIVENRLNHSVPSFDTKISLTYENRSKSRLHSFTMDGEEIGIFLPSEQLPLQDGDYLQSNDNKIIKIIAEAEELLHVTCQSNFELTRMAYHLGNRHVALQIGHDWLRLLNDHVIKSMLLHLQAEVSIIHAPFNPEKGAYYSAHQHTTHPPHHHAQEHQEFNYTPKIHEF